MYFIEVKHDGLKKYRFIQGSDKYVVEQKAAMLKEQWEELWAKRVEIDKRKTERDERLHLWNRGKEVAAEKTLEAQKAIEEVENILKLTLKVNDAINWDTLLNKADYPKPKPSQQKLGKIPEEPKQMDSEFIPKLNFFERLLPWIEEKRIKEAHNLFLTKHAKWEKEKPEKEEKNKQLIRKYEEDLTTWEKEKADFLKQRDERNTKILEFKKRYLEKDLNVVLDYCEMVLANSKYPESFPQQYELEYDSQNKRLLVDYFLPSKEEIPHLKEIKYNKSLNQFKETYLSDSAFNSMYDKTLYEITLRTIHELYESDVIEAISSIVFNGYVKFFDKGTGQEVTSCILSIQAHRDEFLAVNLENVDPKACFKTLKGIGSSKLHGLAPIAPIMKLNKEDKRFVTPYAVADSIDETTNIAAMDWKDFENLIRELFEKEFSPKGGEVKITRASRDEGVDAVVFDPDPLRGGKIIIQAKRYTNPVGVSAVRDLYGTIVNEGAIKGILVTTTDYGPDAYKFAQDKPITLLNGNNLLHMLERHGHRAKIDIQEAKKILAEMEKEEKTG